MRPPKDLNKALLSSPCHFVGEHEQDSFLLAHAWDLEHSVPTSQPSPISRSFFLFAFRTEPLPTDAGFAILPNYTYWAERMAVCLSVLFGKRFDNHGMLEMTGLFRVPALQGAFNPLTTYLYPTNSWSTRADINVELNLQNIARMARLFSQPEEPYFATFFTAGKFYLKALRDFEDDPEGAFLNLISCGEILASYFDYPDDQVMDKDLIELLAKIRAQIDEPTARQVRNRLYQIKKRFVKTVCDSLTARFFETTEAKSEFGRLTRNEIERRAGAAYDVRSQYVHTGVRFGPFMHSTSGLMNEIQLGIPQVPSKSLSKVLALSPTFIGLERMMRFALLAFLHRNGIEIDARLASGAS